MKKNEIMYTGPVTGTLDEAKESNNKKEFASEFDPIQTMWAVNPVDEDVYDGTLGYKDN
ncbi:hypothetical protein [Bacillus sp. HNG]|uniref:hypothetical protein n=1 Tax=Bacillus sp. HNG TaxID=2293325 RepID=UPI00167A4CB6|nr:hypothetical protein [Bacillus sp. HNG]